MRHNGGGDPSDRKQIQSKTQSAGQGASVAGDDRPEFFLVTAPGFEAEVMQEVRWWCDSDLAMNAISGGVSVRAELGLGFALNRVLKTPTRILLRLADFGCRDFPKLFKKIAGFPWEEWVSDTTPIEFVATSKRSRLKIKKRIESTCADGRHSRLKKRRGPAQTTHSREPKSGHESGHDSVTCYVRFDDDVCTLSLDTSGEILHKRGLRPLSSEAPLRENLAALLLILLERVADQGAIDAAAATAGDRVGVELIDPMTGGGTFLIEAALRDQIITTRTFAFERWVRKVTEPSLRYRGPKRFAALRGYDLDAKALRSARENLQRLHVDQPLELINADFFQQASSGPSALGPGPRWVIANPPYGERLRIEGPLTHYYRDLLSAAEALAKPEAACFIFPDKFSVERLAAPPTWRLAEVRRFLNGGLPVNAALYVRKPLNSPRS